MERKRDPVVVAIAIFKLLKGALLAVAGVAAGEVTQPARAARMLDWLDGLPVRAEHHLIYAMANRVIAYPRTRLELVAAALLAYALLFFVEGIGLLFQRTWAEYLTVIATASLIPLEIYELVQRITAVRIAALVVNIAMVIYLAVKLRRHGRDSASVRRSAR